MQAYNTFTQILCKKMIGQKKMWDLLMLIAGYSKYIDISINILCSYLMKK